MVPIDLAPKQHQEHITNIKGFIWRICISYRGLKRSTNDFEYLITQYDVVIEDISDGNGLIYFISLDAAQGYHQIKVRSCDMNELAFFAPENKKYTFTVMTFRPRNTPTHYTMITHIIQDEATKLFRLICYEQTIDLN